MVVGNGSNDQTPECKDAFGFSLFFVFFTIILIANLFQGLLRSTTKATLGRAAKGEETDIAQQGQVESTTSRRPISQEVREGQTVVTRVLILAVG